jgi:glycosyltransferase involved in cell wall biosynthesis
LYKQSGVSLEIIAVNDGSTDNSQSILEDAAHRDSRLVIVNQPNKGLSAARNTGIAWATARWVAFADGDDWLAPDALSTWLQQAKQQQVDLLIGNGFAFTTPPNYQPVVLCCINNPGAKQLAASNGLFVVLNTMNGRIMHGCN